MHNAAAEPGLATAITKPIAEPAEEQLAHRVGRGVAWSALDAAALRLGQFLITIVIARIVAPSEFGVFVVALTVYTIVVNVSEVGVGSAVVREVDRTAVIAPTVTTIAITTSAVLAGLMILSAHPLAGALGAADAADAVRVLGLTVIIGGAGSVPAAVLARDYQQKRVFIVDVSVFVISNGVLLLLAATGSGVLALAWSRVAGQSVSTVLMNVLAPERYRPGFDRSEAKRLLRFGLPLAAANLLGFTIGNIDFMLVGRLRGAKSLGYYNLAFNISAWPVTIFTTILSNVTLTTLSRAREAREELESHVGAALSSLAALTFPVSALCAALAGPLIDTVYGRRWSDAAPALVVLVLFGSVRVILALLSDLLVALGHTKRLLALQVVWLVTLIPVMIGLIAWQGFVGAGVSQTVVALGIVVPSYLWALRGTTHIGFGRLLREVLPPLGGAMVAGAVALVVSRPIQSPLLALLAGGIGGLGAYVIVLGWWLRSLVRRLRMLYSRRGRALVAGETCTTEAGSVSRQPIEDALAQELAMPAPEFERDLRVVRLADGA